MVGDDMYCPTYHMHISGVRHAKLSGLLAIALAGTTETEKMLSCAKQNVIEKPLHSDGC